MRLCILVLAFALTASAQDRFKPNGDPFHNFETATKFDSACASATGKAARGSPNGKQNLVKNNLAARGPAKDITIDDLVALQREIEKNDDYDSWNNFNPPKTRTPFHNMKEVDFQEGDLVRITAYIFEAHTADMTSSGESVNCNYGTSKKAKDHQVSVDEARPFNDIHIALVEDKTEKDECESVTAEVIPHFRLQAWDEDLFSTTLRKRLVRLTGQLMLDGAHKPCPGANDKKTHPARRSMWEVHPVYQVEQCTKDDGEGNCTGTWKKIR